MENPSVISLESLWFQFGIIPDEIQKFFRESDLLGFLIPLLNSEKTGPSAPHILVEVAVRVLYGLAIKNPENSMLISQSNLITILWRLLTPTQSIGLVDSVLSLLWCLIDVDGRLSPTRNRLCRFSDFPSSIRYVCKHQQFAITKLLNPTESQSSFNCCLTKTQTSRLRRRFVWEQLRGQVVTSPKSPKAETKDLSLFSVKSRE